MRGLALLAGLILASLALAAPDEALLGKAAGYPVCRTTEAPQCLVGALSHFDQLAPARLVKAGAARPLKRVEKEPAIVWRMRGVGEAKTLDDFLDENRNTGLLVMKDDVILVERYQYGRKPEHRLQSYSMAKTVVAMLVGIALDEKRIRSIDDLAQDYVPALKGTPYGETSLRHLLTMSSGMRFTERYDGHDDSATLYANSIGQRGAGGVDTVYPFRTREVPAGTRFAYVSADTQVLGLALRAAVKQPLVEYLSEKIWQPMGAEDDATWQVDAAGVEAGFMGINARLRDWARFGLLLANGGRAGERQVIPAEWVKAATTAESPHLKVGTATRLNGYGYQTWLFDPKEPYFAALGLRGQAIFVDPTTKLVVVHTGVYEYAPQLRAPQFALFYGALRSLSQHTSH